MGFDTNQACRAIDQGPVKGIGPLCLYDGYHRHLIDEAEIMQFFDRLTEGRAVAEIAAGNNDPVWDLPAALGQHLNNDGLLSFEAKGIDRIQQINFRLLS